MNMEAMADKASTLHGRSLALWRECADVVLMAKREAKHGEWARFLKHAGISEATARRMVKVAEKNLSVTFIQSAGGIVEALRYVDACDEALAWWTACLDLPLNEAEHADLIQSRPDGPMSAAKWLDYGRAAIEGDGERAYELRPWG